MAQKLTVLFDLDGTMIDSSHRQNTLADGSLDLAHWIENNTPEKILALGVDGLKEYIKTIGLINSKAENVIKTCRALIEKHGGEVPDNREDQEAQSLKHICSCRRAI